MSLANSSGQRLWSNNPNAPEISYVQYVGEKTVFAGYLIGPILYGIVVALFFQCMAALLKPIHIRGDGVKWGFVSYTVTMFSFATLFTATNLIIQSNSYIDNREFDRPLYGKMPPGSYVYGPYQYRGSPGCPRAFGLIPSLTFLLNYWLADGLLLYRCYVIYGMNPWVMVLPCLMYLSTFATGILMLVPFAEGADGCIPWIVTFAAIGVPHYSISISLNILLTLMIVTRLVLHSRNICTGVGVPGVGGLYKTIITMLIESSVIYATSSLLVLVPLSTREVDPGGFMFILAETQVITPLLIILRVANKTALTNNTIVSGRIGTFRARTRRQSTGGDGSYPSEDSMSLLDEFGTNSAEPRVEVETTIESHPDKARAS